MKNKDAVLKTKQFCMAPWTHMHFMPNKDVNPCCLSPIDETIGNMEEQTIKEIWNSEDMRQLRNDMLEGKDCANYCGRCYEKEEDGFGSLRTHMNDSYADTHWDKVESTKEDGTVDDLNLVHWDFRFSNICNQSCRSCGIEFSSQWHGDFIKLWDIPKDQQPAKIKKIWRDVDAFEDDFEELFDKVEYIHFAGGEPLITDEHYKVLEKLIERGRTDITIRYSTNFNQLKYKKYDVIEMWKHFKHIQLITSLDDYGDRYNYIRNGGEWNNVIENYKKLKEAGLFDNGNIWFGIHPTISFWNIYYLPDFHEECIRLGLIDMNARNNDHHFTQYFHLNPLTFPSYYSPQILPKEHKEKVTKKLLEYAEYLTATYNVNSAPLVSLVDLMNAHDNTAELPLMREWTTKLDKLRNQNSKETFPFLAEIFDNDIPTA
jgi:organic radical activating enzyme|tara:strand:- start:411 stop:1700 length:1290 start_codon:yes stop_codon:yes gene_type:complete